MFLHSEIISPNVDPNFFWIDIFFQLPDWKKISSAVRVTGVSLNNGGPIECLP